MIEFLETDSERQGGETESETKRKRRRRRQRQEQLLLPFPVRLRSFVLYMYVLKGIPCQSQKTLWSWEGRFLKH